MAAKKSISVEIQEELVELSPTLAKIPKGNPFSMPAGYFDDLSGRVQHLIKTTRKRGRIFHLANWKLSLAAASVALLMATWIVFGPSPNTSPPYSLDEFTVDEIQFFIENDAYYEIDESMIVASLMESEAAWDDKGPIKEDEEIIEYLMENDVDLELIINEYNNI
jgi:hypothetical protein